MPYAKAEYKNNFLSNLPSEGSIPIEPELANCMDNGENYLTKFDGSECSKNITEIVGKIVASQ